MEENKARYGNYLKSKTLVNVKEYYYRRGGAQRVPKIKVPRFRDNGTGWW